MMNDDNDGDDDDDDDDAVDRVTSNQAKISNSRSPDGVDRNLNFKSDAFAEEKKITRTQYMRVYLSGWGRYSTLAWTGVCRPDLGTLTHV